MPFRQRKRNNKVRERNVSDGEVVDSVEAETAWGALSQFTYAKAWFAVPDGWAPHRVNKLGPR